MILIIDCLEHVRWCESSFFNLNMYIFFQAGWERSEPIHSQSFTGCALIRNAVGWMTVWKKKVTMNLPRITLCA